MSVLALPADLAATLADRCDRVFSLETAGGKLWIKRPGDDKRAGYHRLQRLLASLTGLEILRPTVSRGGPDAIATELGRIDRLRRSGFPVPSVVAVGEGFFITGDSGQPLMDLARALPAGQAPRLFALVDAAARLLAAMHGQGLCHGRPSLKDIAVDGDRLTFLDLEEAPEAVMSRDAACLRDAWLFLTSIGRVERRWNGLSRAAWQAYRGTAPGPLLQRLEAQARRLRPLADLLLRLAGRRLGRDLSGFLEVVRLIAGTPAPRAGAEDVANKTCG